MLCECGRSLIILYYIHLFLDHGWQVTETVESETAEGEGRQNTVYKKFYAMT